MKTKAKHIKRSILAVVVATVLFSMGVLTACLPTIIPVTGISFNSEFEFITQTASGLEMVLVLGQEVPQNPEMAVITPLDATRRQFSLVSSDGDILRVTPTNALLARAVGEVTLQVRAVDNIDIRDEIRVRIIPPEITSIALNSPSQLFHYVGDSESLAFSVAVNSQSPLTTADSIEWRVNSTVVAPLAPFTGIGFVLQTNTLSHGEHIVEARVLLNSGRVLTASETVRIFKPFEKRGFSLALGQAIQVSPPYTSVVFVADFERVEGNPLPVIEWRVNQETIPFLEDPTTFVFLPKNAGVFDISVLINGVAVLSNYGQPFIRVQAGGIFEVSNITLEYANSYPNIFLSWDSVFLDEAIEMRFAVRIETEDGDIEVDDFRDFEGNRVNLSQFVGSTVARNIFNTRFRIFVRSLGGGVFQPGEFTVYSLTDIIPLAARAYLSRTLLDGHLNYYADSIEKLSQIFLVHRIFRTEQITLNPLFPPQVRLNIFVAFDFRATFTNTRELIERAVSMHNKTGYINVWFDIDATFTFLEVVLTFRTDGLPSMSTQGENNLERFNSHIPFIAANSSRASDFVFPIEQRQRTVEVSTSEQLYIVAQLGFRPIPQVDSTAYDIYNKAREILTNIIDDDFTTLQKIVAISNYLTATVRFDVDTASIQYTAEAVMLNSYYLEGVFFDGRAVCDGIAKALSLLLNFEGIEAIRVGGEVRHGAFWHRHAFNMVNYYGEWFNIDLVYMNSPMIIPNLTGTTDEFEFSNHSMLLKTDAELRHTHRKFHPQFYPASSTEPFNFHSSFSLDSIRGKVNFYLDSVENLTDEIERLVDFIFVEYVSMLLELGEEDNGVFSYSLPLVGVIETEWISFDIRIADSLRPLFQSPLSPSHPINAALRGLGLNEALGDDYIIENFIALNGTTYQKLFIRVPTLFSLLR